MKWIINALEIYKCVIDTLEMYKYVKKIVKDSISFDKTELSFCCGVGELFEKGYHKYRISLHCD